MKLMWYVSAVKPTEEPGGTSVFEKGSSNGACLTVDPQQQLDTTITNVEDAGVDDG